MNSLPAKCLDGLCLFNDLATSDATTSSGNVPSVVPKSPAVIARNADDSDLDEELKKRPLDSQKGGDGADDDNIE